MRILTFSDIHFKEEYRDNNFVKNYFNSFKDKLNEINEENSIDIVVIGGDLAFSGEAGQYNELKKLIKEVIPENIPIFSIVGNHEVNWSYLKDAIGNESDLPKLFSIDEKKIIGDKKFHKVFSNYLSIFQNDINSQFGKLNYENEFSNEAYSGYLYSKSENLLILLLNSAWYSFGPGVVEDYFKIWAKGETKETMVEKVPKLLGDTLSQEGKQSYFLNSYPYFSKINKLITDNENIKVLCFAHHPPSWLKWEELYDEDNTVRNFNTLVSLTDILITGHVHNPVTEPTLIKNKCFHVNNGIFLDYHFVDNSANKDNPMSIFPNNWFNIIDVNNEGFELISYKFESKLLKAKGRNYSYNWINNEELINNYFFSKDEEFGADDIENTHNSKPVRNTKNTEKIEFKTPKTISTLIELVKSQRSNKFINPNSNLKNLSPTELLYLNLEGEKYFILINQLDKMYNIIENAKNYTDLKNDTLFNSLLLALEQNDNNKLPVIAFYDVVSTTSLNPAIFESYQQNRFMLFQSFKHNFFVNFEELHRFTELNIVYDIFFG